MKRTSNLRGFRKVEAFIVTVVEGDGTESSPYTEVEYLVLDDKVINLTSENKCAIKKKGE